MSEEVARAVGAGGSTIIIGGKQCTSRPLGIRELTEVERDCLKRYRRQYLESYRDNLDLLPEASQLSVMEQKVDESSRWDIGNLPPKFAYESRDIKVTDTLKVWLVQVMGIPSNKMDKEEQAQRMTAVAMDQEILSERRYMELTGEQPPFKQKVPYVNWWISASYDGMISFVWICFKPCGVTREEVMNDLGGDMLKLAEVSKEIEQLSVPAVGNG